MMHQADHSEFNEISTPIDDHLYKLVNQEPVQCSFSEYVENMQDESQRIVAQTNIDNILISTIFTGIDQSFGKDKKMLFETMIFGLPEELHPKWRYATWEEATHMHNQLVTSLSENGVESLIKEIKNKTEE